MPKGPRRGPPAPKRSRRSGSAAGAGVLRNAPGTGRTGVVVAMICDGCLRALGGATRHSGGFLSVSIMISRPDETRREEMLATASSSPRGAST